MERKPMISRSICFKNRKPLDVGMRLLDWSHLALQITQSCEERDGAVADIIVGLGAAVALPQRKRALGALRCLALTLLVTTEHQS